MAEIKLQHDGPFFSQDNMRHMASKLPESGQRASDGLGWWFISSERPSAGLGRVYTVRFVTAGRVVTVGPHLTFTTKRQATAFLQSCLTLDLPSKFWKVFNIIRSFMDQKNYAEADYWIAQGGGKLGLASGNPWLVFPNHQIEWRAFL